MSNVQLQLRADTAANLAAATPAAAELAVDATRNRLAIGDGATSGGIPHAKLADAQGYGFIANYGLSASASSNNLTIALVTQNGAAPSPANSIYVPFESATGGEPLWAEIASALSLTIADGDTAGAASGVPFRFWILAYYNAGSPVLGFINCMLGAGTATPGVCALDESMLVSPVATIGNSAGVFYSAAAVAPNSPFRVLGYVEYGIQSGGQAGLAVAGVYNVGPTAVRLFGPGVRLPGEVIQATPWATKTTQDTIQSTTYEPCGPTQTITPRFASSLIRVIAEGGGGPAGASNVFNFTITRGSTPIGIAPLFIGSIMMLHLETFDVPGSLTAVTYGTAAKGSGTSNSWCYPYTDSNSFSGAAQIRCEEIAT